MTRTPSLDSNTANNTASGNSTVTLNANLVVTKTDGLASVNPGQTVTHVRWVFTGGLPHTAPNNAGSVQFAARIR